MTALPSDLDPGLVNDPAIRNAYPKILEIESTAQ